VIARLATLVSGRVCVLLLSRVVLRCPALVTSDLDFSTNKTPGGDQIFERFYGKFTLSDVAG
jgi:hypothetical protein